MTSQSPVLLVGAKEQGILDVVTRFGTRAGFEVVTCSGGREAIAFLSSRRVDLVMVDLRMPDVAGLGVLRTIRNTDPECQTVLMTGYASVDTAVEAIKLGALDYLSKPFDFARLESLLRTVREDAERRRNVLAAEGDLAKRLSFCGMIGRSAVMQELFGMIRRLAPHVRTALITGETGTGKELVARALHQLGSRRNTRFVTVNCAARAQTLFETEPFGHMRGAFTGATGNTPGLFERADNGTLFLDEVGELPLTVQAKLLGVLELGDVHGVGSLESRRVDVQVIAATNRDLRAEVLAGRFRSDLYDRLTIVEMVLPPLRERREDVPYLTAAFVKDTRERLQKPLSGLSPGAERMLAGARWEGNVRELRNVIERACLLADGDLITERDLAGSTPRTPEGTLIPPPGATAVAGSRDPELLTTVEREHIQRALARAQGNKKIAAQMLGLSRRALYRKLERLDLSGAITRRPSRVMLSA